MVRQMLSWLCAALLAGSAAAQGLTEPNPKAPLYDRLPAEVKRLGVLRFVGDSHPPYRIVTDDRKIGAGIEPDLARALERVLGVPISHAVVNSLSATLAGLEAGRYDLALGPAVATAERQKRFDGVSWMSSRPSFVYPNDRPARYAQVTDLCGRKISYVAGSVTERVVNRVGDLCRDAHLPPAVHVPLVDTNMTMIATQAGRADLAGMTLTASLHAVHENGTRFGSYSDEAGRLGKDVLSLFVTKRSGLGPVLLDAMNLLIDNGEYHRVMATWGVEAIQVSKAQLNIAK